MTVAVKRKIVITLVVALPFLLAVSCFIYPPDIRYNSYLVPNVSGNDPAYSIDQDTKAVVYDLGGSSIEIAYMQDAELNQMFPLESSQGYYSTNPYTYGNWINPDIGYVPTRFTAFRVSIINRTFAKMSVDPVEALLITDLGENYHSYTVSIAAARYGKSFENYYKSILGQSGNDYYRYEMRLGMVRGKNYGLEEMIFRGASYSGIIAFDPLKPEVKRVRLLLKDVVYRFDAFNRPADVVDIPFNFDRKIDKQVVTAEMRKKELEREKVRIKMNGPEMLVGNRVNDNARNARAIDNALGGKTAQMEECFITRYRRREVDPGSMTLSFTIDAQGNIISQNVVEVAGINSENVMNCILDVIKTIKFEAIQDMPLEGNNIVKGPAKPVNVTYPLTFSIITEEQ